MRTPVENRKALNARRMGSSWWKCGIIAVGVLTFTCTTQLVHASPSTYTFPAPNPGWVIARNGGLPLTDIEGDAASGRDIVGNPMNPALYIASDATHLYIRLRLDVDPRQNTTNIGPFGWGCLINTDSELTTYEYSIMLDGVNNPDIIYLYKNTMTTMPNSPADAPDRFAITTVGAPLTMAVGHAQVVKVNPGAFGDSGVINDDFFMDWAIELAPALLAGFNPSNPVNYYCGSTSNGTNIGADCMGTPPGGSGCGPLHAAFTDPMACGPSGCAVCGDGQKGAAEGCDDGNRANGDGCNSVCLLELGRSCGGMSRSCASGYCDPTGNACACDADADCAIGTVCATGPNPNACVMPGCGNAVLETGEGCDDGNTIAGDGCNAMCLKELGQTCIADMRCASGFCDPDGSICACDQNADCPMPKVCNVFGTPNACVAPGCGNNVVEGNEGCDDGNTTARDGCNSTCKIELLRGCTTSPSCASGFCDPMVAQCICDGNNDCATNQTCNLTLVPHQCVTVGCGNGALNAGEGCDDGNTMPGDGCNSQCLKDLGQTCTGTTECASGFCDLMICACDADVDCPGFQLCNILANPNTCVNKGCGNWVMEVGEGCDDGNMMNGDGCNSSCLRELGEACATSDLCASASCDPTDNTCVCDENADCSIGTPACKFSVNPNVCVVAGCGNGILEAMEGCDDNNIAGGDGCNTMCLLEIGQPCPNGSTTCASGYCDPVGTKCACENDADCPTMQLCNLIASPHKCVDKGCGNGVLEMGEGCDDGNMTGNDGCNGMCLLELGLSCPGGWTTCTSGFCDSTDTTCACRVDADCLAGQFCNTTASPNVCTKKGCGNSVVETNESCDDGNTLDGDGCNSICMIEVGEPCTTSTSCASGLCEVNICVCAQDVDCAVGQVCNTMAALNACVMAGCGNGVLETNEGCDDGNTMAGDGCNVICAKELGQPCTVGTECGSGNCDSEADECRCNIDADCSPGEVCTIENTHHDCIKTPECGNAVLSPDELCDDGNSIDDDGCDSNCTPTSCGNGIQTTGEECDDLNTQNGDGCSASCQKETDGPEPTGNPGGCTCSVKVHETSHAFRWLIAPLFFAIRRLRRRKVIQNRGKSRLLDSQSFACTHTTMHGRLSS